MYTKTKYSLKNYQPLPVKDTGLHRSHRYSVTMVIALRFLCGIVHFVDQPHSPPSLKSFRRRLSISVIWAVRGYVRLVWPMVGSTVDLYTDRIRLFRHRLNKKIKKGKILIIISSYQPQFRRHRHRAAYTRRSRYCVTGSGISTRRRQLVKSRRQTVT